MSDSAIRDWFRQWYAHAHLNLIVEIPRNVRFFSSHPGADPIADPTLRVRVARVLRSIAIVEAVVYGVIPPQWAHH